MPLSLHDSEVRSKSVAQPVT